MRPVLPPYAARPPHAPAAEALARRVSRALPPTLVALWAASGRGPILVDAGEPPRFEPGPLYWRDVHATGALFLPPDSSLQTVWEIVGTWLDRFAGSWGGARRLSEGHGATPVLAGAAQRFLATVALGYSTDFFGTGEPTAILPRAIATYQLERQRLSVADPALAKWLRGTLLDEGLWRTAAREQQAGD